MSKKLTTEEWVKNAKNVHGERYDYTSTIYTNCLTKLTIYCKEHGAFEQLPNNHLSSNGCPKCGRIEAVSKYALYTEKDILDAAKTCINRGEFQQKFPKLYAAAVNRSLYEKACFHMEDSFNKLKSTEQFKAEIYALVENDYSILEDYINRHTKIKFKHNICGNIYKASPGTFLAGRRCPSCVEYGFNTNKQAILYYLKIQVNDIIAYKIGITNLSVKERYSLVEMSCITILFEISYDLGKDAYSKEQEILKEFSDFKYRGKHLLNRGNTELFIEDITKNEKFNSIIQSY